MKYLKGFTLIEVIVVIGSVIIILPALFGIVFSLLRQEVKIYQLSEIKRQGDYALSIIESTIRNSAYRIDLDPVAQIEQCDSTINTNQNVNYFRDENGNLFRYILNSGKISSQAAHLSGGSIILDSTTDITTPKILVQNFSITCTRSATYSSPVVAIQYTVSIGTASLRSEERASMTYRTRIKLRSF